MKYAPDALTKSHIYSILTRLI